MNTFSTSVVSKLKPVQVAGGDLFLVAAVQTGYRRRRYTPSTCFGAAGTREEWDATTCPLPPSVVAIESDTQKYKIGDEKTLYKDLPYAEGSAIQLTSDLFGIYLSREPGGETHQDQIKTWAIETFGMALFEDPAERAQRFLEESLELVQAMGMPKADVQTMTDYVYDRSVGEVRQEIGGAFVTLYTLCASLGLDADQIVSEEIEKIKPMMEKIRNKNLTKPKGVPLKYHRE